MKEVFAEFYHSPMFGVFLAIAFSVIFPLWREIRNKPKRILSWAVTDGPIPIVLTDDSITIHANLGRFKLAGTDVRLVAVELRCDGGEPIRPENVLEPLTITVENAVIIRKDVIHQSRAAIDCQTELTGSGSAVEVRWRILERHDVVRVLLYYVGDDDVLNVTGTLEGQMPLRKIKPDDWVGGWLVRQLVGAAFFFGVITGIGLIRGYPQILDWPPWWHVPPMIFVMMLLANANFVGDIMLEQKQRRYAEAIGKKRTTH